MTDFFILMKNEMVVTFIIFFLLFIKIGKGMKNETLLPVIQVLLLLNFIFSFFFNKTGSLFGQTFLTLPVHAFEKSLLALGVYLISMLFSGWLKQTKHLPEFFILLLSALLGMYLMISSVNLLIFYLSLELASIPVAAMVNFDLEKKRSSEGAMKMILTSAFSSGIFLFGASLIYGSTGTISFVEMGSLVTGKPLEILAFLFMFAAFGFKFSIVPFHLWTADVYEGGPVPTTAFLSVISKGAIAFVFINFLYYVFTPLMQTWYPLLMILAVVSMLVGNLFALRQQNIKRFLAFSSIAQVGFILVGIILDPEALKTPEGVARITNAVSSVIFFILVYIFSNLAAFGVASAIADKTGKENIDDYKGLYKTNPFLTWIMALALFSLAGIPPTAGFFGKLFLLTAGGANAQYWFIIIAALNMIISLYYYLRVVRAMFMDKNDHPVEKINPGPAAKLALILCAAGIVLTGLLSWIYDHIQSIITMH
ncbi:MAG: NADH-quinone oxidoreductase subunit N [Chitinophagaceae bacterium]